MQTCLSEAGDVRAWSKAEKCVWGKEREKETKEGRRVGIREKENRREKQRDQEGRKRAICAGRAGRRLSSVSALVPELPYVRGGNLPNTWMLCGSGSQNSCSWLFWETPGNFTRELSSQRLTV